jgi:hypothetical protein
MAKRKEFAENCAAAARGFGFRVDRELEVVKVFYRLV